MNLRKPLPGWVALTTRVIGYSAAVLIVGVMVYGYAQFQLAQRVHECLVADRVAGPESRSTLAFTRRLIDCVEEKSGWIESIALYRDKRAVLALSFAPCRYVGVWTAVRPQLRYRITLRGNGEFRAEPIASAGLPADVYTGLWGVHENRMVWLYDEGTVWPPDINPIVNEGAKGFTLIERDGSHTDFTLTELIASDDCAKPPTLPALVTAGAQAPAARAAPVDRGRWIDVAALRREIEQLREIPRAAPEFKLRRKSFNETWLPRLRDAMAAGDVIAEVLLRGCDTTDLLDRSGIESDCSVNALARQAARQRLAAIGYLPEFNDVNLEDLAEVMRTR